MYCIANERYPFGNKRSLFQDFEKISHEEINVKCGLKSVVEGPVRWGVGLVSSPQFWLMAAWCGHLYKKEYARRRIKTDSVQLNPDFKV
jgi:hypothetical protein